MEDHYWAFLNKRKRIYWKGFCRKDRNICIHEIEAIVNQYGSIIDFKMFSDLEISFSIEIEEQKIHSLYTALSAQMEINDFEDLISESPTERSLLLNVSFLQGKGNMRIEGPIGPG